MSRLVRYTQLPLTLYRIQPTLRVALRDYDTQVAKGRTSFDLKLHDGLVLPMTGDTFHTPNGMSLRPNSPKMLDILSKFKGSPLIFSLLEGMVLPKGLVVIHEHTDHYSLQTTEPVTLPELNERMTKLLASCMHSTREQFLEAQNDENDQDN